MRSEPSFVSLVNMKDRRFNISSYCVHSANYSDGIGDYVDIYTNDLIIGIYTIQKIHNENSSF